MKKTLRHGYKRAPNLISVTPENRRNNLPTFIELVTKFLAVLNIFERRFMSIS